MEVSFADARTAWSDFSDTVQQLILDHGWKAIGDIGGGANPLLDPQFIRDNQLRYDVIDTSGQELAKAQSSYHKIILDLEQPVSQSAKYEFLFAQMTLEHIRRPQMFYRNVYELLAPGGMAFFFFACDGSLPFIINKIIPEKLSRKWLLFLQPFRSHENHGKFTAYYKWCKGPGRRNIRRLESLHFEIITYRGYFGHSYYHRLPLLDKLEKRKTRFLLKHPNVHFCSYAQVLLKKG